jgi:ABC-type branched-subunit amino acid transport system ATPase component
MRSVRNERDPRDKGLTKRFGGLVAVSNLDLEVERGDPRADRPERGRQSTVFALMSGFLPVTSGRVIFDGKDITNHAPFRIARAGIAAPSSNL